VLTCAPARQVMALDAVLVRDAVVSLEKARARARSVPGGGGAGAAEAQAAVLLDLLPRALLRMEAAGAAGLAALLRAQHARFAGSARAAAGAAEHLGPLDRLAAQAAAASAAARVLPPPAPAAEPPARGALERLITSPSDGFAVRPRPERVGARAKLLTWAV
jgi:hypothetical protein